MTWFPREYLALVGMALWGITIATIVFGAEWLYKRQQRRDAASTAAPESHPKSAE
jgi:cytochrome c-type biogenesis protein CcmH/NrfF